MGKAGCRRARQIDDLPVFRLFLPACRPEARQRQQTRNTRFTIHNYSSLSWTAEPSSIILVIVYQQFSGQSIVPRMADQDSHAMYAEYEMLKGVEQRKNKLIEVKHRSVFPILWTFHS